MDLETLKKAERLNSELEIVRIMWSRMFTHRDHRWSLRFPGDDSVDIDADASTLRNNLLQAVESAEDEILKKIGEL